MKANNPAMTRMNGRTLQLAPANSLPASPRPQKQAFTRFNLLTSVLIMVAFIAVLEALSLALTIAIGLADGQEQLRSSAASDFTVMAQIISLYAFVFSFMAFGSSQTCAVPRKLALQIVNRKIWQLVPAQLVIVLLINVVAGTVLAGTFPQVDYDFVSPANLSAIAIAAARIVITDFVLVYASYFTFFVANAWWHAVLLLVVVFCTLSFTIGNISPSIGTYWVYAWPGLLGLCFLVVLVYVAHADRGHHLDRLRVQG